MASQQPVARYSVLSGPARRAGVDATSEPDYVAAVYDALFQRGMAGHLEAQRQAMAGADQPGLPALTAGLEASGSWALDNQALAQLMFSRPSASRS